MICYAVKYNTLSFEVVRKTSGKSPNQEMSGKFMFHQNFFLIGKSKETFFYLLLHIL